MSVRFLDGPAEGVTLALRSAPALLRVVRNSRGEWDALDQPGDAPSPDETVFVYRRVGNAGFACIDYRAKGGRRAGMTLATAQYCFAPDADHG